MSGDSSATIVVSTQSTKKTPPVWNEVKSDDGSSYFWNTVTNGNCQIQFLTLMSPYYK